MNGPGMQIFSPDGTYGYVCSSFTPETVVVSVADHQIVGRLKQASPFCPNIAVTPDGSVNGYSRADKGLGYSLVGPAAPDVLRPPRQRSAPSDRSRHLI